MPGCPESPAPNLVCYHLWGHPELSTTGDQIFSHNAVLDPPLAGETYLLSLGDNIPRGPEAGVDPRPGGRLSWPVGASTRRSRCC